VFTSLQQLGEWNHLRCCGARVWNYSRLRRRTFRSTYKIRTRIENIVSTSIQSPIIISNEDHKLNLDKSDKFVYIYRYRYKKMYICIYMYIYIDTYICMYKHIYICIYIYLYIYLYAHTCIYICICMFIYIHIDVYIYIFICVYIYKYICIIHKYIYIWLHESKNSLLLMEVSLNDRSLNTYYFYS
jgi:hypothetical protein